MRNVLNDVLYGDKDAADYIRYCCRDVLHALPDGCKDVLYDKQYGFRIDYVIFSMAAGEVR